MLPRIRRLSPCLECTARGCPAPIQSIDDTDVSVDTGLLDMRHDGSDFDGKGGHTVSILMHCTVSILMHCIVFILMHCTVLPCLNVRHHCTVSTSVDVATRMLEKPVDGKD